MDQIPPFAAWSKSPKLRRVSSSGGAALSLAGDFLSRGYNFTGAVFEKDFRSVKHVVARSVEDLFETVGSKYVQSNASSAMRQIVDSEHCREESHQGDRHIFFGTPCQVAGLRRLLNSVSRGDAGSAQFFLVDFFCHGVPSYLAWWAFLDEAVIPQTGRLEYYGRTSGISPGVD